MVTSGDRWLSPEQQEGENREEWKHRIFAIHYGQRLKMLIHRTNDSEKESKNAYAEFTSRYAAEVLRLVNSIEGAPRDG